MSRAPEVSKFRMFFERDEMRWSRQFLFHSDRREAWQKNKAGTRRWALGAGKQLQNNWRVPFQKKTQKLINLTFLSTFLKIIGSFLTFLSIFSAVVLRTDGHEFFFWLWNKVKSRKRRGNGDNPQDKNHLFRFQKVSDWNCGQEQHDEQWHPESAVEQRYT